MIFILNNFRKKSVHNCLTQFNNHYGPIQFNNIIARSPTTAMIQRLLSKYSLLMHFSANNLFSTSTHKQHRTSYRGKQPQTNLKAVLKNLSQTSSLNEVEFSNVCKQMLALTHVINPWENLKVFNDKLKLVSVEEFSAQTLTSVCALIPSLVQYEIFEISFFMKVYRKIQALLEQPQKLTDDSIIRFLDLCYELNKIESAEKLNKVLSLRISQLKVQDYTKYLAIANRRKLPSRQQKLIFEKFVGTLNDNLDSLDIGDICRIYRYLKVMNKKVLKSGNLVAKIEKIIHEKLAEMQQKDTVTLLNFRSGNNIFSPIILHMIFDSIDHEGRTPISTPTIFKLLIRISDHEQLKMTGQQEQSEKFMKFLGRNLDQFNSIYTLIRKNFFSLAQIEAINKMVVGQNMEKYNESLNYLFELSSRNILLPQNYKHFFQRIKQENKKIAFNEKFFATVMIVQRISQGQRQNSEVTQAKNYLHTLISKIEQTQNLRSSIFFNRNLLVESFNNRFGHLFTNSIINKLVEGVEKVSVHTISYLVIANDWKNLSKLLNGRPHEIQFWYFRAIIAKISNNPNNFIGNFEIINNALNKIQIGRNHRSIVNYLCNFDVHVLLKPHELKSFLKLARKINKQRPNMDFISYFLNSPNRDIRCHREFINLLHDVQDSQVQRNGQDSVSNLSVALELMRLNRVSRKYAQILIKGENNILRAYSELILKGTFDLKEFTISPNDLFIFMKCRSLDEKFLSANISKIEQAIGNCDVYELQESLVNFELSKNPTSIYIFQKLALTYIQKIKSFKGGMRTQLVLHETERLNLRTKPYQQFLQSLISYTRKISNKHSVLFFEDLLKAATVRGIDCSDLMNELVPQIEKRLLRGECQAVQVVGLLPYLITICPERCSKIVAYVLNRIDQSEEIQKVMDSLILLDSANQDNRQMVARFLEKSIKFEYDEAISRYFFAGHPKSEDLLSKLKLVPAKRKSVYQQVLVQFLQKHKVAYSFEQKYGNNLIKVGEKYFAFNQNSYSLQKRECYINFILKTFDLPQDKLHKVFIIFQDKLQPFQTAEIISRDIPQLRNMAVELIQAMSEASKKNKTQLRKERKQMEETKSRPNEEQQVSFEWD